jgi:alpha-L-glutamate ligase-like protein
MSLKAKIEEIRKGASLVLGINRRNLGYIYPSNDRRHFIIADDKFVTKDIAAKAGIPVPRVYGVYSSFYELRDIARDLAGRDEFVIKPAMGRGGGGIVVVVRRDGSGWRTISDRFISPYDMKKHISDILFGVYSFDLYDKAIVEERICQSEEMTRLSPFGLADVRVIVFRNEPVFAMTRIPTRESDGKANLHQGALGVGIDLATGVTVNAAHKHEWIEAHPETGVRLVGLKMPHWSEILDISRTISRAVPLKYIGVDISISTKGPVLLEINVRPGLEIQNVNMSGLRARLEAIKGGRERP